MRPGNYASSMTIFGFAALASVALYYLSALLFDFFDPEVPDEGDFMALTTGFFYSISIALATVVVGRYRPHRANWKRGIPFVLLLGASMLPLVKGSFRLYEWLDDRKLDDTFMSFLSLARVWIQMAVSVSLFAGIGAVLVAATIWSLGFGWRIRLVLLMLLLSTVWSWLYSGLESSSEWLFPGGWQIPISLVAGYWVATSSISKSKNSKA